MRGLLKYSYHNMNEGSVGWFPIENLIKLKGRWQWLGSPSYAEILDLDEYFDVEAPADVNEFVEACAGAFVNFRKAEDAGCFSEDFLHDGQSQQEIIDKISPLIASNDPIFHLARLGGGGDNRFVGGYYENSLIGALPIPPAMKIARENDRWQWIGNGRK
jgi:hypothetical protein